ncbi:hypothetical protein [Moorena producens]|uniref:hypothetical protein n=1 Tax=Moorena producens TaxID=1155739 RepID=UPI003C78E497
MDAYIKFKENVTEDDSYNLKQLAALIEEDCDLSVNLEKQDAQPGVKDGGFATGITIASFPLTVIQTLISVLQYWQSKTPKYSLSIIFYNQPPLLIDDLSLQEVNSVIAQLDQPGLKIINIQISRKR